MSIVPIPESDLERMRDLLYGGHPEGVQWQGDEPMNDILDVVVRAGWGPRG